MLAIIGGSSLVKLPILEVTHRQIVRTPYGDPSCPLLFGRIGQHNVVFMARHGYGNSIAPHEINYRANIWALKHVGAQSVISVLSVGGIRAGLQPGNLIIPHDIIDYTFGRKHTYFEGIENYHSYVDFTYPFDESLRKKLLEAAAKSGVIHVNNGIYACTQGPRLESRAEVIKLERDGADIVGMTGMPECALARELDLPYVALSLVTNYAAGKDKNNNGVEFSFSEEMRASVLAQVFSIIKAMLKND